MCKSRYLKIFLVLVVSITLILTFSLVGCKEEAAPAEEAEEAAPAEEAEVITIGYSLWTMEFTFFQNLEKGVRDACSDFGYEYIMIDQNSDPTKMVQDMNSLVGQGVTGMVSTPVDPGAIGPAVEAARDAGIPVVCADIGKSGPVNALIISDNFEGGQLAAEYIDKLMKDDPDNTFKVGCGNLNPQWTYARQRGEGFVAKSEELGYEVASNIVVETPSAEGGFDTMQQIMSAAPDIVGAFFCSGREAVGAANAVEAAGEDIIVVGYNGDPEELQAIEDGILAATILQQPYVIGYMAVEILKEIIEEGAEYEDAEVPAPVELVTPDNLAEIAAELEKKRGIPAY
ncbi:MAG: substrate-binding domain-containing protein [Actinobacteria bacterium]|nr:substrate-binding domain-containing protein [Actinomycetota bacterium]